MKISYQGLDSTLNYCPVGMEMIKNREYNERSWFNFEDNF